MHAGVHTHTRVLHRPGILARRLAGIDCLTQKRMREILISAKPQAATFPSINTFSLVPSPVWQGRGKIFHSLKRALGVYSSGLGRASRGFPVMGWTARGASALRPGLLRMQGSEPHRPLLCGRLQASAFRRSDPACVLYTGGRPLAWMLVEASGPDVQNPSRVRGIWEGHPDAPPPGLDSSPVALAVSAPGRPWRPSPDLGVRADCTSSQGTKSHSWLAHPQP